MIDLKLPSHPGITLSKKKIKSLSEKYFSIPKQFLNYYPAGESYKIPDLKEYKKKRKQQNPAPVQGKKRKVGRPKKVLSVPSGIQSITTFFRTM